MYILGSSFFLDVGSATQTCSTSLGKTHTYEVQVCLVDDVEWKGKFYKNEKYRLSRNWSSVHYLIYKAHQSFELLHCNSHLWNISSIHHLSTCDSFSKYLLKFVPTLWKCIFCLLAWLSKVINVQSLLLCQGFDQRD